MTATLTAGAVSREVIAWHAIDWRAVHRNVRRLQARIVKATQAGRWGKVKALQHLLTHSFSGKALAVRRVTENRGKRTAGVDGQIWATPASKGTAIQALKQHGYRPAPLRRLYILKSDGKRRRPLSIPTLHDRAMQALYRLALDPVAETTGDPNSYGFRKGRSPADAIERCFNILCRQRSAPYILEGDIRACFDELSHPWLEQHLCMEKPILRQWLKAGFVENGTLHPTEAGAPQGGICSPVMANGALDGLERTLQEAFRTRWDVRVYYQPLPFAHTKLFLVDDHYAQIGSANIDPRSLRLNFEMNIEAFDKKFSDRLLKHLIAIRRQSRKISLDELYERPLPSRTRDALAWLFSPYL